MDSYYSAKLSQKRRTS